MNYVLIICTVINIIVSFWLHKRLSKKPKSIIANKIISAKKYALITRDENNDTSFDYNMDDKDMVKMGGFMVNYFGQTDANINEVNDIISK